MVSGQLYQITYEGSAPGDLDLNDVVISPVSNPVVTITGDGDVIEGSNAGWTLHAMSYNFV